IPLMDPLEKMRHVAHSNILYLPTNLLWAPPTRRVLRTEGRWAIPSWRRDVRREQIVSVSRGDECSNVIAREPRERIQNNLHTSQFVPIGMASASQRETPERVSPAFYLHDLSSYYLN